MSPTGIRRQPSSAISCATAVVSTWTVTWGESVLAAIARNSVRRCAASARRFASAAALWSLSKDLSATRLPVSIPSAAAFSG